MDHDVSETRTSAMASVRLCVIVKDVIVKVIANMFGAQ